MNNGAFGENFPYSNFHDLNMDWIIKIAKDFLDQYTHIQDVIEQGKTDIQDLTTSGLEQLQDKADNLEELLQAWYNEHSEDIANQLADALSELNDWYTTHESYLDQILIDNINAFNTNASQRASEAIESIPSDYTDLYNKAVKTEEYLNSEMIYSDSIYKTLFGYNNLIDFTKSSLDSLFSNITVVNRGRTELQLIDPATGAFIIWIPLHLEAGMYKAKFYFTATSGSNIRLFESNKTTQKENFSTSGQEKLIEVPSEADYYLRLYFLSNTDTLTISGCYFINNNAILLADAIGYKQLASELKQFYLEFTDQFSSSTETTPADNVTRTKNNNTITLETTNDSAYCGYNILLIKNHKYVIYYDITGQSSQGNYYMQFRAYAGGFTKTIGAISNENNSETEGIIITEIGTNEEGILVLNMPNHSGMTITGTLFVYDVTGIDNNKLGTIDFSSIGTHSIIMFSSYTNSDIKNWPSKTVVFYGDSITQGVYPDYVQSILKCNMVRNAVGGSTFGYEDENSLSSDSRIEQVPQNASIVCIMGGTNDWARTPIEETLTYNNGFDRTKFKGAVAYTIKKMQAQCPYAKIYLCTNIGGRGNADPSIIQPLPQVSGIGQTPLDIRNATIEVANELNIPVIDTWSCGINGLNRSMYISDTVHPNSNGAKLIAEYIVNNLPEVIDW